MFAKEDPSKRKVEVVKLEISTQAGLKALVHPRPVLTLSIFVAR